MLNLLIDLKEELGLTYVFISHDLNVVRFISDRVIVMYLGEVVETGPVEALWSDARHPYTRALLAAMPSLDPDHRTKEAPIAGDPPNPIDPPSGCRFHTRCAFAEAVCSEKKPVAVRRPATTAIPPPATWSIPPPATAGRDDPLPGRCSMPDEVTPSASRRSPPRRASRCAGERPRASRAPSRRR